MGEDERERLGRWVRGDLLYADHVRVPEDRIVEKKISDRDSPLGNQNLLFLHPKLVREYPGPTT
jgi:hypothetical protein